MVRVFWVISLMVLAWTPRARAQVVVLGCVDCRSSMSLVDATFRRLFPQDTPRWILFQSTSYDDSVGTHSLEGFPQKSILSYVKLQPLQGGISDAQAAELARSHGARYVLAGMDSGPPRAAVINSILGFKDNDPQFSELRVNKRLGAKVAGRFAIPTHELTDLSAALKWVAQLDVEEIFIKPDQGKYGEGAQSLSRTDPDLRLKLQKLLDTGKLFLIQPKIRGRKFFASTFTDDGKTKVVGAAEYFQIENRGKPNYFLDGVLSLESEEARAMQEAVDELMPAHGIETGMGHPEFILCEKTGKLYLLEMNGRITGGGVPGLDSVVYGISQLELQLLKLFDYPRFKAEFAKFPRPRRQSGFVLMFSSPADGVWDPAAISRLSRHSSYFAPGPQYVQEAYGKVTHTTSMDLGTGAFFFVGSRDQVRNGVGQAVELFSSGRLIDHSLRVNRAGVVMRPICPNLLIGDEKAQIVLEMNRAMDRIDWRKF